MSGFCKAWVPASLVAVVFGILFFVVGVLGTNTGLQYSGIHLLLFSGIFINYAEVEKLKNEVKKLKGEKNV